MGPSARRSQRRRLTRSLSSSNDNSAANATEEDQGIHLFIRVLDLLLHQRLSADLAPLLAAHKAASPAGESPAMVSNDEPFSHNQRGRPGRPGPRKLGCKSPGQSGASHTTGP